MKSMISVFTLHRIAAVGQVAGAVEHDELAVGELGDTTPSLQRLAAVVASRG